MLEVVVLPILLVKDMENDVPVVKGHPLTTAPAFLAEGLAPSEAGEPFDLFGNGPNLAVIPAGGHDEDVKSVDELAAVQNGRVEGQLLGGSFEGGLNQRSGGGRNGPVR